MLGVANISTVERDMSAMKLEAAKVRGRIGGMAMGRGWC